MGGRGGSSHRPTAGGGAGFGNARSFLTQAYGQRHADAIMALLQNAPANVRGMWEDYGDSFRADPDADPNNSSQAYYSSSENWVYLGINATARGDAISTPYSVVFHEYGHMSDYLIGGEAGYRLTAYSDLYQGKSARGKPIIKRDRQGGLLGRTAKEEVAGHIRRMQQIDPSLDRREAAQALIREVNGKYSRRDRSDISDMMEGGGIGVSYPMGAGHGASYWGTRGNSKEIFAEITSAEAAHPGSLKAIKEYFPRTYQVYQDMVKARKKK